ncbi:hypothetical protein PHMEG_00033345 [Phytophthora megakarya]|uniref:Jacalin-type lectin domain-containing protein n=1 Tax=Phytophthora megakarya TaxID=4795 RepID=A0A225UT73_9STRA|nr:hypothetical protein PHMEG_00033345 [Phytophthora megakarya]
MKFFMQVMATATFVVASGVAALNDGIQLGGTYGGPHGHKYSDQDLVEAGQTVQSIVVRGNDRVDAVSLDIKNLAGQVSTLKHGGGGGDEETLALAEGEHITGIEVHWGKYYRKTRVMYVKFTTDKGNTIDSGTPQQNTDKKATENAPEGFQLGGFVGFAGQELDSVGAVWTSINKVQ